MAENRTCPPCTGDCNQGRECSARALPASCNGECHECDFTQAECFAINAAAIERHEPLPPPFTADELRQQLLSPWTGLNIALALVLAAAVSGLLLDAAARAGWL